MNIINQSLWETLVNSGKPVILYGMGNGADKILDFCAEKKIKVDGIFASDEFARGHSFRGYPVKKLSEIQEIYQNNFCILLSFASKIDSVIKKIYDLNDTHELYVPNFPAFGENIYFDYDYYLGNKNDIEQTYDLLADEESKKVYENAIHFYITGTLEYLKPIESTKKSALDLLNLQQGLHYIDLGAYDGDTIAELLNYDKNIKKITAFEPDEKNFAKLEKNLREKNLLHISKLYNLGAWSREDTLYFSAQANRNSNFDTQNSKKLKEVKVNSLDNILNPHISNDINIDININDILIKYDVEGAELEALTGSREIIKKYSPKLIVSLYHKTGDIFKLPLYIKNINENYKFYLRKHKYIPCWDLNLYAIPAR